MHRGREKCQTRPGRIGERATEYLILTKESTGEIEVQRSRFIATLRPVESEPEASAFFAEMKKTYWDARHNCSCFVIGPGAELTRCSDDGEPSGTAGRPMLDALLGSGIRNCAVVVTRYFGGILLGTGGLVRAYTAAVKAGIDAAYDSGSVSGCTGGTMLRIEAQYTDLSGIQRYLSKRGIEDPEAEYGEKAVLRAGIPTGEKDSFVAALTDLTSGRAVVSDEGETLLQKIRHKGDGV